MARQRRRGVAVTRGGVDDKRVTDSKTVSTSEARQASLRKNVIWSWLRRYRNEPGWTPNPMTVYVLLASIRIFAAIVNGIADCDETYNYWEPLHMVLHGSGMQTWEYSPEFGIRSYAFLLPYAGVARLGSALVAFWFGDIFRAYGERLVQFYAVRIAQAMLCAVAELSLYDSCVFRFGSDVARLLLLFLVTSPGIFRASSELLPSSFAMIFFMFATSSWFLGRFQLAVLFVAVAAELGWPFAALLGLPIAMHVAFRRGLSTLLSVAGTVGIMLLVVMVPVDSFYFGRLVVAPLNIILYNVFPAPGAGPELYGTEPASFYAINLLLNCNVAFLALASYPLLWSLDFFGFSAASRSGVSPGRFRMTRAIFLSPCFLWLVVFFKQPHKEERFLAPVYPLIALVGAVAVSDWCLLLREPNGPSSHGVSNGGGNCPSPAIVRTGGSLTFCRQLLRVSILTLCCMGALVLGMSRIVMQVQSFAAPFQAFIGLSRSELRNGVGPRNAPPEFSEASRNVNICIGKEWYRFPSHFFLPGRRFRLRFVQSGFKGLLPKPFDEGGQGTRVTPVGMNMFNKEDPDQYVGNPEKECHYFVDLVVGDGKAVSPGGTDGSALGVHTIPQRHRLPIFSEALVDLERSPVGYRSFWVPTKLSQKVVYGMFEVYRNVDLLPVV